jgi:hypothetical protein
MRPRLVAYGLLFASAFGGLVASAASRKEFDANLIRMRGAPYVLEDSHVRNQFELHVTNKNPSTTTFHFAPEAPMATDFVVAQNDVKLEPLESVRVPIFATVARADFHLPFDLVVKVTEEAGPAVKGAPSRLARARFLGPIGGPTGGPIGGPTGGPTGGPISGPTATTP